MRVSNTEKIRTFRERERERERKKKKLINMSDLKRDKKPTKSI